MKKDCKSKALFQFQNTIGKPGANDSISECKWDFVTWTGTRASVYYY